MIPELIHIGFIPVHTFGLMVALAFIASGIVLERELVLRNFSPGSGERYLFAAAVSGLLGARVWYVVSNWSYVKDDVFGALTASAGFTFFGGFIIASIVVVAVLYRDSARHGGVRIGAFADAVAPSLSLGYAVGRLGCQLSGDGDYGRATESWWGMSYATGVIPTPPGLRAYPTPFFESVLALGTLWLVLWFSRRSMGKRNVRDGDTFFVFLICMGVCRFGIEFLRIEPRVVGGFTQAQVIGLGLALVGAAHYGYSRIFRSSEPAAAAKG